LKSLLATRVRSSLHGRSSATLCGHSAALRGQSADSRRAMGNAFAFNSPGGFPTDGTKVSVSVRCSHTGETTCFSGHDGWHVTSEWTIGHLERVLQTLLGVHPASMKLMFAGRICEYGQTIQSILGASSGAIPVRLKFFLLVDRTSFPQQLGPFSTMQVELKGADVVMPPLSDEFRRDGFYWELKHSALERVGLTAAASNIICQVSPAHPLSWGNDGCDRLAIPKGATSFAWCYACSGWDSVDSDAYILDTWMESVDGALGLKSFLSVGGFVYFDDKGRFLGASTVGRPVDGEAGEMHFSEAMHWSSEWTKPLLEQGRFQPVTIKRLRDMGARMYVWLYPGEVIEGEDGNPLPNQPEAPHGAFVYLFHDDILSPDPSEVALDRYFAVIPFDSTKIAPDCTKHEPEQKMQLIKSVPAKNRNRSPFRAFTVVDKHTHSPEDAVAIRPAAQSRSVRFAEQDAKEGRFMVCRTEVPDIRHFGRHRPMPPLRPRKQV